MHTHKGFFLLPHNQPFDSPKIYSLLEFDIKIEIKYCCRIKNLLSLFYERNKQTNKNSPFKGLLSQQNTSLFGETLLFYDDNIQFRIISSEESGYAPLAKLQATKRMFI